MFLAHRAMLWRTVWFFTHLTWGTDDGPAHRSGVLSLQVFRRRFAERACTPERVGGTQSRSVILLDKGI